MMLPIDGFNFDSNIALHFFVFSFSQHFFQITQVKFSPAYLNINIKNIFSNIKYMLLRN